MADTRASKTHLHTVGAGDLARVSKSALLVVGNAIAIERVSKTVLLVVGHGGQVPTPVPTPPDAGVATSDIPLCRQRVCV